MKLKELPKSQSASAIPNGNAVNSNSKASTQIKITRTPSGGVEFTTVPANGAPASGPEPSQASMTTPPSQVITPKYQHKSNTVFKVCFRITESNELSKTFNPKQDWCTHGYHS